MRRHTRAVSSIPSGCRSFAKRSGAKTPRYNVTAVRSSAITMPDGPDARTAMQRRLIARGFLSQLLQIVAQQHLGVAVDVLCLILSNLPQLELIPAFERSMVVSEKRVDQSLISQRKHNRPQVAAKRQPLAGKTQVEERFGKGGSAILRIRCRHRLPYS